MKLGKKVRLKPVHRGIEISISGRRRRKDANVFDVPPPGRSFIYLILIGYYAIPKFIHLIIDIISWEGRRLGLEIHMLIIFTIVMVLWLGSFIYICYRLFAKERILIRKETMIHDKVLFGLAFRKEYYALEKIRNIQIAPVKDASLVHLLFDYGAGNDIHTFSLCKGPDKSGIEEKEAQTLVQYLSEILEYHCHLVERIVFGNPPSIDDYPYTSLHNPDVSNLTCPFFNLKKIVVYPDTYDSHLVESFLTYAVNSMDKNYLKKHVEVHVHGDMARLDPNLRNNFQNLCKSIFVPPCARSVMKF